MRIEKDGALCSSLNEAGFTGGARSVTGAIDATSLDLVPGTYVVDIVLDDASSANTAIFWQEVEIVRGETREISFSPTAADFLPPDQQVTIAGSFVRTKHNSSKTVIGELSGGTRERTQVLSVPQGTGTVYFSYKKKAGQSLIIGGAAAASVTKAESGTVDGQAASSTVTVFTVNTADIATDGGDRIFTLTLGETDKTPIIYTVTVTLPHLIYLRINSWPTKVLYLLGEEFDPAGLVLMGAYTDTPKYENTDSYLPSSLKPITSGYTVEGFDTALPGDKVLQFKKNGIIAREPSVAGIDSFTITVHSESARQLFFDYGVRRSSVDTQPDRYTIPQGRPFVLAPVKWLIPDNATYEWTVNGVIQDFAPGSDTEFLKITPPWPQGDYAVTVTARLGGTAIASASTTVTYVGPEATYKRGTTGTVKAERLMSWEGVAPGQHGQYLVGNLNGAGGFGGYTMFKFDHSVPRNGTNGEEIKIGGNAFGGWNEPGIVWVSQDLNGNGLPDDTWYELVGSHSFDSKTVRRYAVAYHRVTHVDRPDRGELSTAWVDSRGAGGRPGPLQAYREELPSPMTLVGTLLDNALIYADGVSGYADVGDTGRVSLSNAIQVNGDHVDLEYIDFIRIQTAIHYYHAAFGNGSPEAGTPTDRTMHNPDMLIEGKPDSNRTGYYNYEFKNNSGYVLTLVVENDTYTLNVGATIYFTFNNPTLYIDYYGGNAEMTKESGSVIFIQGTGGE
jgi:hypothetical protein